MDSIFYDERNYVKPEEDSWQEVLFELTTHCNLNCPFCLNASSAQNDEYMSLEDFKIMVHRLKGKISLLQLSGGEPLSNPEIIDMMDYLIQNQMIFHINTNGTMVTDEIIERLLNYPGVSIQISLDGANAATDDVIRCEGHFNKVVSLMKKLNEKGFRKGIIKMVINRLNYDQIEDYFYLGMKYNFLPTYAFLVKSGRAKDSWGKLCVDDSLKYEAREKIRRLLDDNVDYIKKYSSKEILYYLRNMNIDYVGECHFNLEYFNFSPYIHADGSAQPCEGLFQKEFSIGNLITESPEEIYDHGNQLVKKFADEVKKRRMILNNGACKECVLNETCGKGCIAEAFNAGDFYGKPTDCGMRKRDFIHNILGKGNVN